MQKKGTKSDSEADTRWQGSGEKVTIHGPPPACALVAFCKAPVSLLAQLRLLMWVEFLILRLDLDLPRDPYMRA